MNKKYKVNTGNQMHKNRKKGQNLNELMWSKPCHCLAFSLVEIMVVVAVIGVIAGMVLAAAGGAQKKAARGQAQAQIKTMTVALERYRSDQGAYPEALAVSRTALYTNLTNYMAFQDSQTNKTGEVLDPYGYPYRYRSPATATRSMLADSFEIWSCGADGKSDYDRAGGAPGADSRDDITSWQ
jgi:general secretion pathway protein G